MISPFIKQFKPQKLTSIGRALFHKNAYLIKPEQMDKSRNIYVALCKSTNDGTRNIFLPYKNGPLLTATDFSPSNTRQIAELYVGDIEAEEEQNAVNLEHFPHSLLREFSNYLDPKIIEALDLKNTSNWISLLYSYNFFLSAQDPIVRRNRISAIKAYPLIQFVLAEENYEIERVRQRQSVLKSSLFSFFEKIGFDNGYRARIDQGQSMEILHAFFAKKYNFLGWEYEGAHPLNEAPWATKLFLNRMRHAPSLYLTGNVGILLGYGAIDSSNKFNHAIYQKLVSNLPCSIKNPEKFATMLASAEEVIRRFGLSQAASHLFINDGPSWTIKQPYHQAFKQKLAQTNEDGLICFWDESEHTENYFKEIAGNLLVPAYYDRLKKYYANQGKEISLDLKNYAHFSYIFVEMKLIAQKVMSSFFNSKTLQKYAHELYKNRSAIDVQKPFFWEVMQPDTQKYFSWEAIFDKQTIHTVHGDYTYEALKNSTELILIAKKLDNCLINFCKKCMDGDTHIILGESPDHALFLVEISKKSERMFMIEQMEGSNKTDISTEQKAATTQLIQLINSGKIKLNEVYGAVDSDRHMVSCLGFDPFCTEESIQIFKICQKSGLLPKKFNECSLYDFLNESGIHREIETLFKMIHPEPAPSNGIHSLKL